MGRVGQDGRRFTERNALKFAPQVTRILKCLHGFSPAVNHRDIKPGNLILDDDGRVHLIDFGAARDLVNSDSAPLGSATVVGTYGYMPYEQFAGKSLPASDIYALGATLVHLLSRREPAEFETEHMRLCFEEHVNVSAEFAAVLRKMLEPRWERPMWAAASDKVAPTRTPRTRIALPELGPRVSAPTRDRAHPIYAAIAAMVLGPLLAFALLPFMATFAGTDGPTGRASQAQAIAEQQFRDIATNYRSWRPPHPR